MDSERNEPIGVTRRTLLRSGVGATAFGLAPPGRGETASRPDDTDSAREDRERSGDGLSVRAAAEWMDRSSATVTVDGEKTEIDHRPRRLRGNGPPFAPDRFDENGDRRASPAQKATYDGKQTTAYFPRHFTKVAYDMGMINRTPPARNDGNERVPAQSGGAPPLTDKGLAECHRWTELDEWRSVRNTLQRHERGQRVRCLWLNTTLLLGPPYDNRDARARELGRLMGVGSYDVVACCEVFKDEHADAIVEGYKNAGRETVRTRHTKMGRLLTIIGHDEGTDTDWSIPAGQEDEIAYESQAGTQVRGDDSSIDFKRGYHRNLVDLTSSRLLEGFELFSTHLATNENAGTFQAKIDQLKEFTAAIHRRQENPNGHPQVPKIAVGDLNVKSDQEYNNVDEFDLDTMTGFFANEDMQDAWLTHGGPAGGTIGEDVTRADDGGFHHGEPYPGGSDSRAETCYSAEFFPGVSDVDVYKQTRLDYVFIEKPKPAEHNVSIDVSRMWRVPFSLDCPGIDEDVGPYKSGEDKDRLVDHAGIGFELLVTPT